MDADLTKYRQKLIGSEEERAVSPVIGVILMVAITVILAAVIAAFVLDMGDDLGGEPVTATVDTDVTYSDDEITISATDTGNADTFLIQVDSDTDDFLNADSEDGHEFSVDDLDETNDHVIENDNSDDNELDDDTELKVDGGEDAEITVYAVDGNDQTEVSSLEVSYENDI